MNNNIENNWKNAVNEQELEQAAGGRGIPHPVTGRYRCQSCGAERTISHPLSLPTVVKCSCEGNMVRID